MSLFFSQRTSYFFFVLLYMLDNAYAQMCYNYLAISFQGLICPVPHLHGQLILHVPRTKPEINGFCKIKIDHKWWSSFRNIDATNVSFSDIDRNSEGVLAHHCSSELIVAVADVELAL